MSTELSNPSQTSAIDRDAWSAALRRIASQPLEFCPDFPALSRRHEAWWAHDVIDRPLFLAQVNPNPERPITKHLELLDHPQAWLAEKLRDMRQWHRVGDTLNNVRVDFGPVMLGGLLGGKVEFQSDTTWTHAFITDDWNNAPTWTIDHDNSFWRQLITLTNHVARDCPGRYVLCTPDFSGCGDVLMNLRGPDALCLDVIEQPQRIVAALNEIHLAWRRAFAELYRIALRAGAPIFHWLGVWSDRPYVIPACDFNFLIGPREFETFFLPQIERQAKAVGRAVFHLDGPGAARHIDSLLSVSAIDAIQFTPGSGTPSVLPWIAMFQKIQSHGRSVLIVCPSSEVETICDELRPQGLCIMLADAPQQDALDDLFDRFRRRYGAAS